MNPILAVKPVTGTIVHLTQLGYQPSKKRRSIRDAATLCGIGVRRDQERVPLADALKWPNPDPGTTLRTDLAWSWCRSCVGHAVSIAGLSDLVLNQVAVATP